MFVFIIHNTEFDMCISKSIWSSKLFIWVSACSFLTELQILYYIGCCYLIQKGFYLTYFYTCLRENCYFAEINTSPWHKNKSTISPGIILSDGQKSLLI